MPVRPPRKQPVEPHFTFLEFFAGGGMARAGLGPGWRCLFANDFDHKKSAIYRENWEGSDILTDDVGRVTPEHISKAVDLAWASFPCQDLSLAGMGAGLRGDRSGTFWPFWHLMELLRTEGRGPRIVVLENVCGTLSSHGGKDFEAIGEALTRAGYRYGALVIDAKAFVPQSRPRLFIIAVAPGVNIPAGVMRNDSNPRWHTPALCAAYERLGEEARHNWTWWHLPAPKKRNVKLAELIEANPQSVSWHTPEETERLLVMMSPLHRKKVRDAQKSGRLVVGTIYKRTRVDEDGAKVQRAEVRFDGVAGCLRTSSGGSSRQLIILVEGEEIRSRLLSSREAARLMGLPDSYKLPSNYNEAYHLTGDGLVVPVVRFLTEHLLEPIANSSTTATLLVA